jgi:hypothetical protein
VIDKKVKPGCIPTERREIWLSRISFIDLRDGRHRLVPVSRVCSRWNTIANGILYEQVQVIGKTLTLFVKNVVLILDERPCWDEDGDDDDDDEDEDEEPKIESYLLARTLGVS